MVQVIWSNTAVQDLRTIGKFIAMDSEHYSKIFVARIKHTPKINNSGIQIT